MDFYTASIQHLLAELEWVDLLIQFHVNQARKVFQADEFQGLYISEQEVDSLLARPSGLPSWAHAVGPGTWDQLSFSISRIKSRIATRVEESRRRGVSLRLDRLARAFDLSPLDISILLVCLAPEIDLRYERLYAYLQDDVTRKWPGVDLVLNLLAPSLDARIEARRRFFRDAPLMRHHLLDMAADPSLSNPPLLGRYLRPDERITGYLLDSDDIDSRLYPHVRPVMPGRLLQDLPFPADFKSRLALLAKNSAEDGRGMVFYFQGALGVGRRSMAEALCRQMGTGLLVVDGKALRASDESAFHEAVDLVVREARLQDASIYWNGFDDLAALEDHGPLKMLMRGLDSLGGVSFLAGNIPWEPFGGEGSLPFLRVEFPLPSYSQRVDLWASVLDGNGDILPDVDFNVLAGRFRLSGGQIRAAAATARSLARWRDPDSGRISAADLYEACRRQSNRRLSALARKIAPVHTWDDIVLPPDRLEQLREICGSIRCRARVYSEWGFDKKLSMGKGLNVLFAGPSGTGKTMAAEIMAGTLGLELYKIDLSTVVSKYIGETEKNLAKIFDEAETSNAILFFDEADALFGRRSEIRDSHDRYANIEVSYLLQRMEEYKGVVILATNLRKNMDEAFVRRMHFTVEFPFPGIEDRRRIWEGIWPERTPRSPDLDLEFMARRFEIAGGNIRNIALAAAFLAADDGGKVTMEHLIRATRREFQKMGKVVLGGEFDGYVGAKGVHGESNLHVTGES